MTLNRNKEIVQENREKVSENKQRHLHMVDEHQQRLREEVKPGLREKAMAHRGHVEELRRQNKEKAFTQKIKARDNQATQLERQAVMVEKQRERVREQQAKQEANKQNQERHIREVVEPKFVENQTRLESSKAERRTKHRRKGILLLAYSTMPSKPASKTMTYSPKTSMMHRPVFAKKIGYSPKFSSIPAPEFGDSITYSPKCSLMPKQEPAEKMRHSSIGTVPRALSRHASFSRRSPRGCIPRA